MPKLIPYLPPSTPSGNTGLPYLFAAAGGAARQADSAAIDRQNVWDITKGVTNFAGNEVHGYLQRQAADQERDNFIQHAETSNPGLTEDPHWQMGKAAMMGGMAPKDALGYIEKARTADALNGYRNTMADTASKRADSTAKYQDTMGGVAIQNAGTRAGAAQAQADYRASLLPIKQGGLTEAIRGHDLAHQDRQAAALGLDKHRGFMEGLAGQRESRLAAQPSSSQNERAFTDAANHGDWDSLSGVAYQTDANGRPTLQSIQARNTLSKWGPEFLNYAQAKHAFEVKFPDGRGYPSSHEYQDLASAAAAVTAAQNRQPAAPVSVPAAQPDPFQSFADTHPDLTAEQLTALWNQEHP